MLNRIVGAVIAAMLGASLAAQAPRQTFDVASIKRRSEPLILAGPALLSSPNVMRGGQFRMPDVTVATLIQVAWGLRDFQVTDGPQWMWSDRFEVQAEAASKTASPEQLQLMVRSLLEDRFGLAVHWEQREISHFALVPVRTDGRLGPYLQRRDDCRNPETRMKRPQNLPSGTRLNGCGPPSQLAATVSRWADILVIDATGLEGTFDFFLFLPDGGAALTAVPSPDDLQTGPPLSSVLGTMEEYLGLTLKSTRGPVEVLVVDSLRQPTEN